MKCHLKVVNNVINPQGFEQELISCVVLNQKKMLYIMQHCYDALAELPKYIEVAFFFGKWKESKNHFGTVYALATLLQQDVPEVSLDVYIHDSPDGIECHLVLSTKIDARSVYH